MTPSRPYLIRAIYEWLTENGLTPYMMVNAGFEGVEVPDQFIDDGKIVLNIAPEAIRGMEMSNQVVTFEASFSGIVYTIYVPVMAVQAIYAYENGRGMVFDEEEDDGGETTPPEGSTPTSTSGNKAHLKIIK